MAKKHGLGTVLLIGAAAAAVAGGVISYIKRAEIKRLAEDIITKVKPTDARGIYTVDFDAAGQSDAFPAEPGGDGRMDTAAAGEPNIVDSGISLESVEKAEPDSAEQEPAEIETEAAALPQPEAPAEDGEPDGGGEPDEEADGETAEEPRKKKVRFWSK